MSEQYGWKFILDDTIDITDKIKSFSIETSMDSHCRELSFAISDVDFFDSFDFSIIPEETRVEVFTRIVEEDEYDDVWLSQGRFFMERPTYQVGINETDTGIWGRQSTAILGEPFAQKVSTMWKTDTSFYMICQELLESVGLVWDTNKCEIQDFNIGANNFEAADMYPIEALKSLVSLIVGEEGFVTSDRFGNIWIRRLDRTPSAPLYDVTDLVVQSIREEPEWPEFGNRIKIIPSETLSQDKMDLYVENQCIGVEISQNVVVFAQIKNGEDIPVNDVVVSWSFSPSIPKGVWFRYPNVAKMSSQNSSTMLISNERVKASGFNSLNLAFQPDSIIGIWAYADRIREINFAPENGYAIFNKTVELTETSFDFCNQTVFVSYYASGMVKNKIEYNATDSGIYEEPEGVEDLLGSVTLIASVSGREATSEIYVNNFCQCKSILTAKADPGSISIGGVSNIEAYLENSGVPVEGTIRMVETSGFGTLEWSSSPTSVLSISEKTEAINVLFGQTQCVVSSVIDSLVGVWLIDSEGRKTGSNLIDEYDNDSFYGRVIDLNTHLLSAVDLFVEYNRAGSVTNYLTGIKEGTSRITVSADSSTEEGLNQIVEVVISPVEILPPPPPPVDIEPKEVPPPPRPGPPSITVNSSPTGAKVYNNGVYVGTATYVIDPASLDSHTIRATFAGYPDIIADPIDVKENMKYTVNCTFTKVNIPPPPPPPPSASEVFSIRGPGVLSFKRVVTDIHRREAVDFGPYELWSNTRGYLGSNKLGAYQFDPRLLIMASGSGYISVGNYEVVLASYVWTSIVGGSGLLMRFNIPQTITVNALWEDDLVASKQVFVVYV